MEEIKPKAIAGDIPVYCAHDKIVSITKVVPNPRNPNTHPDRQLEILSQIIKEQGWRQPITVSKRSGFIVKGHGRYQAAIILNADKVPVDYQDYANEAEEWADLIADNRIAELSNMNEDLLSDLLCEINELDFDMLLTGMEYADIDDLIGNDEALTVIDNLNGHSTDDTTGNMDYTPKHNTESFSSTEEPQGNTISDYEDIIEKRKSQTGEIDLDDFSEDKYKNQCPKCKFMW